MFDSLKLRKRVLEVEEEVGGLKREMTRLQVEWTDTLDRLKSMLGRIVKDRARAEAARSELSPDESGEERNGSETSALLSSRQQQINAQILSRRNRMRPTQ